MPLSGTAFATPQLSASPNPVMFVSIPVGQGKSRKMTITNTGSTPAFAQSFTIEGPNAAMFRIAQAGCPNGPLPISIEPQQVCELAIVYTPASSGAHAATLRVNLPYSPAPFDVPLAGSAP